MSAVAARKAAALALAAQRNTGIIATPTSVKEDPAPLIATSGSNSPSSAKFDSRESWNNGKRKRRDKTSETASSSRSRTPQRVPRSAAPSPVELEDSANEEDDDSIVQQEGPGQDQNGESFMPELFAPSGRPKKRRRVDSNDLATPLSTYCPIKGVNYQSVDKEEIEAALDACATGGARPDFGGMRRARGVVIGLSEGDSLILSGTTLLTPLRSSLSINSTTISHLTNPGSHPIYAPLTHPLPVLSHVHTVSTETDSRDHPLLAYLALPPTFVSMSDGGGPEGESEASTTMFLLQALDSGLEGMANGAVAGMGRIWPDGVAGVFDLEGCFPILQHPGYPVHQHVTPRSWSSALSSFLPSSSSLNAEADGYREPEYDLARPLIALVKGPRRSGKSTFARELVNGLLSSYERVAYLDCDLGQSEFGCGGVVGLFVLDRPMFGPSFSHPANPVRSHFLGALNPRLLHEEYLGSIASLLEHYRYDVQYPGTFADGSSSFHKVSEVVPLIINTQGWVRGLGADLLAQIEQLAQATHTFAFREPENEHPSREHGESANGFQQSAFGASGYEAISTARGYDDEETGSGSITYQLEPVPTSPLLSKYSPAELRTLSVISYMHATISTGSDLTTVTSRWTFDLPLVAKRPWHVDLGQAIKEIYIVGEGADGVIEADVRLALNGSLIGLLERLEPSPSDDLPARYEPGRSLPHPDTVNCLGVGLVRAVSPDETTIQLLTPLTADSFSRISIIVKGELELPLSGLLDWRDRDGRSGGGAEGMLGLAWAEVPFLSKADGERGVGMAKRRFRRNLMRKNQGV